MQRYILTLVLAIASLPLFASSLTDRADSAYAAEDYALATQFYNQAIKDDGTSSDLYYNLGNTYYRQGKNAQAILAYERALRLDPSNADARANLDFVNERIVDKKGDNGSFLSNTYDSVTSRMSSNGWAWTALALFVLTLGCTALYMFSSGVMMRKTGFFGGIALLILTVGAVILSFHAHTIATRTDYAIITAPATVLSTVPRTPSNRGEEAMLLHEGTKVRILNSATAKSDSLTETWYDVQVDNTHRAWINGRDIEKIL